MRVPFFDFFLTSLFLLPSMLTAQSFPPVEWDRHYGGNRSDKLFKVVQNIQGGFAAAGETRSNSEGERDMLLLVVDQTGAPSINRPIGSYEDDVAYSLINDFDGGYVLAGFSSSQGDGYQGARDAIILKTDDKGNPLGFKLFGTPQDDEFRDILQTRDGAYLVTGHKNSRFWLAKIDKTGQNLLWETTLPDYEFSMGNALTLTRNGELFITGHIKAGKITKLLLAKASTSGEILWHKTYVQNDLREGRDVIETASGDVAVSAVSYAVPYRTDMSLLIANNNGDVKSVTTYGRFNEEGFAVGEDHFGNLYLAGAGVEKRGDRGFTGIVDKVKAEDGSLLWETDLFLGTRSEDQLSDVLIAHDGSVVVAGQTNRLPKGDQAWMVKLASQGSPPLTGSPRIQAANIRFVDLDGNGVLTPGERAYLSFELNNSGNADGFNIQADLSLLDSAAGVRYFPHIVIGRIRAGASKFVTIPLFSNTRMESGNLSFRIQFSEANGAGIDPLVYEVEAVRNPQPQLVITGYRFTTERQIAERGKPVRLEVEVANTGNKTAEQTRMNMEFPYKVSVLANASTFSLGNIAPKETKKVSCEFIPQEIFLDDTVAVNCRFRDATADFADEKSFYLPLNAPIMEIEDISGKAGKEEVLMAWAKGFTETGLQSEEPSYSIRLYLKAGKNLTAQDVATRVNGQPVSKDVVQANLQFERMKDDNYTFSYTCRGIPLQPGDNAITVWVNGKESPPVTVSFNPIKPNLHLLAIGTKLRVPNGQFFSKDAEDFAGLFKSQENRFFEKVFIQTLTSENATRTSNIRNAFYQLSEKYLNGEIKPEDIVVVFIASQATANTEGVFRIKASDYDGRIEEQKSIDFQNIIQRFLGRIQCQKFLFLDTFIADRDEDELPEKTAGLASRLIQILGQNADQPVPTFMACSSGEISYQDEAWQNGAFTKAILEALSPDGLANTDSNKNNVVSIGELYNFLRNRVPAMITQKRPAPLTTQTPLIPAKFLEYDFGIFSGNPLKN